MPMTSQFKVIHDTIGLMDMAISSVKLFVCNINVGVEIEWFPVPPKSSRKFQLLSLYRDGDYTVFNVRDIPEIFSHGFKKMPECIDDIRDRVKNFTLT